MLARRLAAVAVVLTILAIGRPAVARAQHPQGNLELGIDLGLISNHEGSLNGSSCSTDCSTLTIAAPVDVRLGFGSGATTFEPRFTLIYVSHAGETDIALAPDANVVVDLGGNPREGAYLTGGMGLKFLSVSSGGSSESATEPSLNAGVGTRLPWGSTGAVRFEAFFRYNFENGDKGIPSSYDIGARIGLSLWH